MTKQKKRDGFHIIDGKQTDTEFHKEDLAEKEEKKFRDKINKLYRTR